MVNHKKRIFCQSKKKVIYYYDLGYSSTFWNVNFCRKHLDSISTDLDDEIKNIAIVDENIFFSDKLMNSKIINFTQVPKSENRVD